MLCRVSARCLSHSVCRANERKIIKITEKPRFRSAARRVFETKVSLNFERLNEREMANFSFRSAGFFCHLTLFRVSSIKNKMLVYVFEICPVNDEYSQFENAAKTKRKKLRHHVSQLRTLFSLSFSVSLSSDWAYALAYFPGLLLFSSFFERE